MIIPYGHEGMRVRGFPWVTITIFVLCCAVFLLTAGASSRAAEESAELFSEIAEIYLLHPTLGLDPEIEEQLFQRLGVDENQREVFVRSLIEGREEQTKGDEASTQRNLDTLVGRFWTVYRGSPHYRFGVVPREMSPVDLLTYQFLHAGWGHLIGNLLFLYLVGPHIEQRWGRPVFLAFYLLAGMVAALFWAIRYPDLDLPLVGASGSIAGLMGAFLICFGTSKIRFFYWFVIVWGTFQAPAWLMLPLWLIMEVISGRTMDVMSDGGGGVAHWAHVWGFIFGMAFAWVMGVLGLDQRLAVKGAAEATRSNDSAPVKSAQRRDGRSPVGSTRRRSTGGAPLDSETRPEETGLPTGEEDRYAMVLEVQEASGNTVELRGLERLRVVDATPLSLGGGFLQFAVGQGNRRLDLTQIEAVSVGAVNRDGYRPFLIVDLLLDSPSNLAVDLRVLRLRSASFDPRSIVGGDDAMASFLQFIERLLSVSGAVAMPDDGTVRAPSSRTYASVEEYQRQVLGVE